MSSDTDVLCCPLVFYPLFGLHSALGFPPSFQSPVFIWTFLLQQTSALVLVSHSVVGSPCPGLWSDPHS